MTWTALLLWAFLCIYLVGFMLVLTMHVLYIGNVTPALALLRSLVWPIFWATGWPHGVHLPMD